VKTPVVPSGGNAPAVAGLCLLALLAHGDDPEQGPYHQALLTCLEVILKSQNAKNGYIGSSMYHHGFATLALAEAYGALQDERIAPSLKRAVDLLLAAQARNPLRAWRYSPESSDADSTVSGACAVALIAARNAGLGVPDRAIEQALKFYALCFDGQNGFGYVPGTGARPLSPTTAIGVAVAGEAVPLPVLGQVLLQPVAHLLAEVLLFR